MAGEKHYLDNDGLLYYNTLLKSKYLDGVTYSNNTLVVTKNGTNQVSIKPLLITAQTLTEQEQAQVRSNIGAGSSGFSGDFSDLSNIPTTIAGYGITDASANSSTGAITLGSVTLKPVSTAASQGLSSTEQENARANIGAGTSSFDGAFASLTSKPTTISGYGITDASANASTGAITLGSATLKPVSTAASQGLSSTEQANARANIGAGTSSFDGVFSSLTSKPTTVSGYGITDASINGSTITLGSNSIKPVSTAANQGLTDTEKANARANLGVDIAGLYHYKGSVATKAALDAMTQSSLTVGDVYNVESDGMNYAYVSWDSTTNKPVWDALGGSFTITSITNAEIDAIVNPT